MPGNNPSKIQGDDIATAASAGEAGMMPSVPRNVTGDNPPRRAPAAIQLCRGVETEADHAIQTAPMVTNSYLLLIAIDYYEDADCFLYNPVRDANAFLLTLLDKYNFKLEDEHAYTTLYDKVNGQTGDNWNEATWYNDGHGNRSEEIKNIRVYNDRRIKCLYNKDATVNKINSTINALINSMEDDSQLLIYYAGHGFKNNNEDGSPFTLTSYLHNIDDITQYLNINILTNKPDKKKCRNLLLIIDACYSESAGYGSKKEGGDPFSREIITSGVGKVTDGTPGIGSPFCIALTKLLHENIAVNELKAAHIIGALNNKLKIETNGMSQEISYGKAPTYDNGRETFIFELKNKQRESTRNFVRCLIQYLNFSKEKIVIEEIGLGKGDSYILVSSVCGDGDVFKLLYRISSRELSVKLRLGEINRTIIYVEHLPVPGSDPRAMGHSSGSNPIDQPEKILEDIWKKLANSLGESGAENIALKCIKNIFAKMCVETDGPLVLSFSFSFIEQEYFECLECFIDQLLSELDGLKKMKIADNPETRFRSFFIHFNDLRAGVNRFKEGTFSKIVNKGLKVQPILFHKDSPMQVYLTSGHIEAWYGRLERDEQAPHLERKDDTWLNTKFGCTDRVPIFEFIEAIASESAIDKTALIMELVN